MYIAQTITIILAFIIGKYIYASIYISLILMVVSFIIINIIYFCAMFSVMKISYKKYLKDVISNFFIILSISLILKICVELIMKGIGL